MGCRPGDAQHAACCRRRRSKAGLGIGGGVGRAAVLRSLATRLLPEAEVAEVSVQAAEDTPPVGAGETTKAVSIDLVARLCRAVPREDMATLVHRLLRRTVGLGEMWQDFCRSHGQAKDLDPHDAESDFLLNFICQAVAEAPGRVAAIKRPTKLTPFMLLVVHGAQESLNMIAWPQLQLRAATAAAFASAGPAETDCSEAVLPTQVAPESSGGAAAAAGTTAAPADEVVAPEGEVAPKAEGVNCEAVVAEGLPSDLVLGNGSTCSGSLASQCGSSDSTRSLSEARSHSAAGELRGGDEHSDKWCSQALAAKLPLEGKSQSAAMSWLGGPEEATPTADASGRLWQ